MVLESLFPAEKIENKPIDMLILSVIISYASMFLAYVVFPEYAGVVFPLLITVAMTPVFYNIFIYEEEIEREEAEKKIQQSFLNRHGETIYLFSLFFLGVFFSIFLATIFLPENLITEIFKPQIQAITAIQSITGAIIAQSFLEIIVFNNLKIMLFSFILSFIFGTGAVFILGWNASILAVFLANFVRKGEIVGFFSRTAAILPHAPVEILAYFLAGIAGGMLSAGIIREKVRSKEFWLVLRDSIFMFSLSILAVVLGAFLEIYL